MVLGTAAVTARPKRTVRVRFCIGLGYRSEGSPVGWSSLCTFMCPAGKVTGSAVVT